MEQIKNRQSGRILSVDVLRGLAVIGMYVQHFALRDRNAFVSGNTMILFMIISGLSFTLLAESQKKKQMDPHLLRIRMLARAVFLEVLGYLIQLLNGPFGVVLPFLGAGRCALSLYCVQFILAWILTLAGADPTSLVSEVPLGDLIVVLVAILIGWLLYKLPLNFAERGLRRTEKWFMPQPSVEQPHR